MHRHLCIKDTYICIPHAVSLFDWLRILLVLLLLGVAHLSSYAQPRDVLDDKIISISWKNVPLATAVKQLTKKTGCTFSYHADEGDARTRITLQIERQTLRQTLKALFGEGIELKSYASQIFIRKSNRQTGTKLSGIVLGEDGQPLEGVWVHVQDKRVVSNTQGQFAIDLSAIGQVKVRFSKLGWISKEMDITLLPDKEITVKTSLTPGAQELEAVHVVGRSALQGVKEQAYNVEVLDAKKLHHTSLDLATAMDRVSGMRVRTSGGAGSKANFSVNGFSGNHVKIFIDGVPIESFGNTFQLSNIPIAMANRVEVYKGVSPVSLASDALGGVINVVTDETKKSFLDVSYSYGSFNTHKTFVNGGYRTSKDWIFKLNLIHSYSDNDYMVDAQILDTATSQYFPGTQRVRRFHDRFHNAIFIGQIGLVDKPYADRLFLGINIGDEHKDEQTGSEMKFAFGQVRRLTNSASPFLNYEKKKVFGTDLDLKATVNYDWGKFQNVDTSAYYYNWLGQAKKMASPGEFGYSLATFKYRDGGTTLNVEYNRWDKHRFALTNIVTFFGRSGTDPLDYDANSDMIEVEKKSFKNVTGFSYQFVPNDRWNTSVFVKNFVQHNEGPQSSGGGKAYTIADRTYSDMGYGLAGTYFFPHLQAKFSAENTLRLPTTDELFGNESYNAGNIALSPERSQNYNLNLIFDATLDDIHQMELALGFTYRRTKDFIIRAIGGSASAPSTLSNHGLVDGKGFNADLKYYFKNWLSLGGNLTYQDMRFRNKYDPGDSGEKISLFYNTRVPNNPYFFSNGYLNADLSRWVKRYGHSLRMGYNTLYVYEFPLYTPDYGAYGVAMIPTQFTHNASITYGIMNDRLMLTGEVWNMTDKNVYDNFSFQKAGRSFTVKLKYSIIR